jgi:diguanylate cyclase (GGDEF)-like protein
MTDDANLERILSRSDKLPTLPGIAIKILGAVQKERPDLQEIGEILATDPPLSAEVLRLINSSLYGLPRKVTSVFHAVNMLGLNTVKNLALSFALVKQPHEADTDAFDYPQFWKMSLTAAIAAREIAQSVAPETAEDMFFIGLLHDMGRLALARCMPDQYRLVACEVGQDLCAIHDAENQVLGFDHMAVGRYLLRSWGLPRSFYAPVACHHAPDAIDNDDATSERMCRIMHLAILYTELLNSPRPDAGLGLIDHYANAHGFSPAIDIDAVGGRIIDQTHQVFPFFDLTLNDEAAYLEIVDRARAELISVSGNFVDQLIEQQRQIQALRRQATHDGLTQLMNFQFFHETLGREMARSRRSGVPLTVIMADLDRFKAINDTYGHLAGDQALQNVASILKTSLRETDLIARYGGEEFAVILFNILPNDALAVADRVRQAISDAVVHHKEHAFPVTMSFGIATMQPGEDLSKEDLLTRADTALYRAKSAGRNRCQVYQNRLRCVARAS